MNKANIKKTLLELEQIDIEKAQESYNSYFGEVKEGERTVDNAHTATVVRDRPVLENIEKSLHDHDNHVATIEAISFDPKEKVEAGAIVQLKDRNFIVSVLTSEFECDGVKLMGISTDAPIYKAMEGLEEGDEFEVNGKMHEILEIH